MHSDQQVRCSSHCKTSCKESVVSSLFNRADAIIANRDDLTKENVRIKQVLKENGYQETISIRSLRELLKITACLSHNNKRKPQIFKRKRQNEYKFTVRCSY